MQSQHQVGGHGEALAADRAFFGRAEPLQMFGSSLAYSRSAGQSLTLRDPGCDPLGGCCALVAY